jgi:hypothetical protein
MAVLGGWAVSYERGASVPHTQDVSFLTVCEQVENSLRPCPPPAPKSEIERERPCRYCVHVVGWGRERAREKEREGGRERESNRDRVGVVLMLWGGRESDRDIQGVEFSRSHMKTLTIYEFSPRKFATQNDPY